MRLSLVTVQKLKKRKARDEPTSELVVDQAGERKQDRPPIVDLSPQAIAHRMSTDPRVDRVMDQYFDTESHILVADVLMTDGLVRRADSIFDDVEHGRHGETGGPDPRRSAWRPQDSDRSC